MKKKETCLVCKVKFDNWVNNNHYEDSNNNSQEKSVRNHFCSYCSLCKKCAKKGLKIN